MNKRIVLKFSLVCIAALELNCIAFLKRDVKEDFPEPKELMVPITVIIETDNKDPLLDKYKLSQLNVYSDWIASCACLVDYNVFINEMPPKNERFDYVLKIKPHDIFATSAFGKVMVYFSIFTLAIIPSWQSRELSYDAILLDKNDKELKKFSSQGSVFKFTHLFLLPVAFSKHARYLPPVTWAIQDVFSSSLVPKVQDF